MSTQATTPYDVFQFFLAPAHITAPRTVTVESASIDDIYNPKTMRNEPAIVLTFRAARRVLKLNKTQAESMMAIAGEIIAGWQGVTITLSPAKAKNGKATIAITMPITAV